MANWKRRLGLTVAGFFALLVLALCVGYGVSRVKLGRTYDIKPVALQIPSDSASVYRGRTLAELYGCTSCHIANYGGEVMFSAFPFLRVVTANLTSGKGGVGGSYRDSDWDRAVRHGIGADGHKLLVMPSHFFTSMMDRDLAQIIAYLKSVPPVDTDNPRSTLWPVGHLVHAFGVFDLVPSERIDHTARRTDVATGVTVEYGRYLATPCRACHGEKLIGGPAFDPEAPPAPNIAKGTAASQWTEAQFINTIRTGTTPDGRHLRPQYMPWKSAARFSDDELRAIWKYVQTMQQ